MLDQSLRGCHVLVAEDEYLLADDIREALLEAGADVVGPVGSVDAAMELSRSTMRVHTAILDVNLRGEMIYPVADYLSGREIPFIFATGYDGWALPDRFNGVARLDKPLKGDQVVQMLTALLAVAG